MTAESRYFLRAESIFPACSGRERIDISHGGSGISGEEMAGCVSQFPVHLQEAPQGRTRPVPVTGRPISSASTCPPKEVFSAMRAI